MYQRPYQLGSHFRPTNQAEYRQKKIQEFLLESTDQHKTEKIFYKYWDEVAFINQFLDKNRLKKVIQILAQSKLVVKKYALLLTVIVLYEIDLFLETGKNLYSNIISEIINLITTRNYKYESDQSNIRSLKTNYFNKVGEITRNIFKFGVFSSEDNQYYYEKIRYIVLQHFPDQELYFDLRGPFYFSKILLGHRILQEMDEYSYSLQTKKFTSNYLSPNDVKVLGQIFFKKYIQNQSQFKSSHLLSLNIIRSIDNKLSRQIIRESEKDYGSKITASILRTVFVRHKEFFRELIDEFVSEKFINNKTRKRRGNKNQSIHTDNKDTIYFPSGKTSTTEYLINISMNFHEFGEHSRINTLRLWEVKRRRRNK